MDPVTWALGGVLIGVLTVEVKDLIVRKDWVEEKDCEQRRAGCGGGRVNEAEITHIKESLARIERRLGLNGTFNPPGET